MGGIRQLQRRALEYVIGAHPMRFQEGMRFYLNQQEIYFLGVSRGVGTCSDLHQVEILLFGTEKTDTPLPQGDTFFFAALVSDADIKSPRRIVEGLQPALQTSHSIRFACNNAQTSYISI